MQFGIYTFPTDLGTPIVDIGQAAEAHGFDSLFVPEHTHIPVSRETPYPGGGPLPVEYQRTLDPFVALTAVAATTTDLVVGTAICLVVERDAIVTAKLVASLDQVSGGRFRFGVGAGWNEEEMRNHGTDPRQRMAVMRERIGAMRAIWERDEAAFDGTHVNFDAIWSWPKPVQRPHPPIYVGGWGPGVLDRVLALGQGWMPLAGRDDGHVLADRIGELRRRAAELGHAEPEVVLVRAVPEEAAVERYRQVGVTHCLFAVPTGGPDTVLPLIERYGQLRHRVGT